MFVELPSLQSQAKKVSIITKLLAACQDVEAKYIIRSLEGKLRIGNAERTVLVALGHATVLADKEKRMCAPLAYVHSHVDIIRRLSLGTGKANCSAGWGFRDYKIGLQVTLVELIPSIHLLDL